MWVWKEAKDCILRNVVPHRNLKPGEGGLLATLPSIILIAEAPRSAGRHGDHDEVCGRSMRGKASLSKRPEESFHDEDMEGGC